MSKQSTLSPGSIASRVLAALVGGYALAYGFAAFLSVYLPLARPDRVAFAGLFSLVSNLLYLALPIYTFQIYGRVMTSYSVRTLLVITFGVLLAFVISGVIDDYRAQREQHALLEGCCGQLCAVLGAGGTGCQRRCSLQKFSKDQAGRGFSRVHLAYHFAYLGW